MRRPSFKVSCICPIFICILSSCSHYQVSVNDRVVYNPPNLFIDYEIADVSLANCVKENIEEQRVVDPKEMEELLCSAGDIRSLSGLNTFVMLKKLGLQGNKIRSLEGLEALTQLEQLDLSDNQIELATTLNNLLKLEYVDLSGNPKLDCESLTPPDSAELKSPKHCLQ
jgi:Leucine-rich repeat (LRR) protein